MPVYINGRFVSQRITGVQRYAAEVVMALDKVLGETNALHHKVEFQLLVPPNVRTDLLPLRYIIVRHVGRLKGHTWEQLELCRTSFDGVLVGLANTGPICHPRQLVTIHDASVFANPENFSLAFRSWYRVLIPWLGRRAKKILTVSKFSKSELIRYCNIPEAKIEVVYNGADHIIREPADSHFLLNKNIRPGSYFLCVATSSPNKNIGLVIDTLPLLDDVDLDLVTVGGVNPTVFSEGRISRNRQVHELGYVSDSQLRALYENALCFVFPSFYEGFGIPPLEAMACGCPVIVAKTSALPESCGKAALYCDPRSPRDLAAKLRSILENEQLRDRLRRAGHAQAAQFTWETCARNLYAAVQELSGSDLTNRYSGQGLERDDRTIP